MMKSRWFFCIDYPSAREIVGLFLLRGRLRASRTLTLCELEAKTGPAHAARIIS